MGKIVIFSLMAAFLLIGNTEVSAELKVAGLNQAGISQLVDCNLQYKAHELCEDTCFEPWYNCLETECDQYWPSHQYDECRDSCDERYISSGYNCLHDQCDCKYFSKTCPDPSSGNGPTDCSPKMIKGPLIIK